MKSPGELSTPEHPLDLDLLAHDYVLGQLDARAEADWEARLAVDQSAREAVVRAMQIAEALSLSPAERRETAPIRSIWRRFGHPVLLAAGAAAAAVLVALMMRDEPDEGSPQRVARGAPERSQDAELLIDSWLAFDPLDEDLTADALAAEIDEIESATDLETTDWLMSAFDSATITEERK